VNSLTGREEDSGTSIVDVTDPRKPRYLAHIPGEPGQAETGGAQMARVCSGRDLPKADKSKFYLAAQLRQPRARGVGRHAARETRAHRRRRRQAERHAQELVECDSGIAYLVSGLPDWLTRRMTQVFDLSDPARPLLVRNFGLPGQQPGASGPVPTELHGPISTGPKGNRVYLGYGTNKDGILQIVDRAKLLSGAREPTPENLLAPQCRAVQSFLDERRAHDAPGHRHRDGGVRERQGGNRRDFVVVVNESLVNECSSRADGVHRRHHRREAAGRRVELSTCPRRAGISAAAAGASARTPPTRTSRRCTPGAPCSWLGSMPACARSTSAIRTIRARSAITIPATPDRTDKRCVKAADGGERCQGRDPDQTTST